MMEKIPRVVKNIIGVVMTVVLVVLMLSKLTTLMEAKRSVEKYADFFEQEEDFDVLFFGTSHVINAVYPMELWNDYGIVSYNFGGHANNIPTSYWVMRNALEYTNPKLVVIDCLKLSNETKIATDSFSYAHLSMDVFPTSLTKIQGILDLMKDDAMEKYLAKNPETEDEEERTIIGLLWDFSVYHSRWSELTSEDFEIEKNLEKGAESRINVVRGQLDKIDSSSKTADGRTGEKYLRKMIEYCQDNDIEVLLTFLPFPAAEYQQKEANRVYDIAEEYGVNYLNFLDMDIINYDTDLYDENSHLNPSGARKVTDYLGNYISTHYDVEDRSGDTAYESWYDDYEEYTELKNTNLSSQKKLINYLMLLSGDSLDADIKIANEKIYKDEWMAALLDNIENADIYFDDDDNADYGMKITVKRDGKIIDEVTFNYSYDGTTQSVNATSAIR